MHLARWLQSPWHAATNGSPAAPKGKQTMFIRFDIAQRAAVSVVAALAFAGLAISAAVPVLPIA
ncbi:hypothetical protein SAQ01S_05630 [Sphingomonas aquatilis NBRC 16722]|nr:hypothetical protein SAQ01S_05630 [Sphingomonas aquatilis NBRC 16722]